MAAETSRTHRRFLQITTILAVTMGCRLAAASEAAGLEGGGLESLPAVQTEPVPVANGGFEEGISGWKLTAPEAFSVVQSGAHDGKACLRFDAAPKPRYTATARLTVGGIRPGIYTLRFWVKLRGLEGVRMGASDKYGGARVSFQCVTDDGQRFWPSTEILSGTSDWQQQELLFQIASKLRDDEAAISVNSYSGSGGRGEAWFDDFTLERRLPPPVEAFLLYPNYRGYLPDDGPQTVRLWVCVNREQPGGPVELQVGDAAPGGKISVMQLPPGAKEQVVAINAAPWPLGSYLLRVTLGVYRYPAYLIRKISGQQRRRLAVWFDENNVAHLDGKPAFPIGFYNAGAFQDLARLDTLMQSPANFTIDYQAWPMDLAGQRQYLGELTKRGLSWYLNTTNIVYPGMKGDILKQPIGLELAPGATVGLPNRAADTAGQASSATRADTQENIDRFLDRLAQEMRKIPGHGGWYVMDERPLDRIAPTFHQYTILRRADPDHPTYGVSNRPAEFCLWRDTLDVFGLDPYPLFNMAVAGHPLSLAGQWTREGGEATQGSRPLWIVIQFFHGWSQDRWPTEEELRTMSLMAIVEGARGVFYWSFGVRALAWVKDPQERAEYWSRALKVTKELKQLEPALIARDTPEIVGSVSDPRVRWRARAAQGKWYVFAYLPAKKFTERSQQEPVAVTFTLQDGQAVSRNFRPDTADWFEVSPKKSSEK